MSHLLPDQNETEEFKTFKTGKTIFFDDEDHPFVYLPSANTINIFVGQNNSGKSRFLRGLLKSPTYSQTDLDFVTKYLEVAKLTSELADKASNHETKPHFTWALVPVLYSNMKPPLALFSQASFSEALRTASVMLAELPFQAKQKLNYYQPISSLVKFLIHAARRVPSSIGSEYQVNVEGFQFNYRMGVSVVANSVLGDLQTIERKLALLPNLGITPIKPSKKIFIPTLRTTHSIYKGSKEHPIKEEGDVFATTVTANYKFDPADKVIDIHTGLNLYNYIKGTKNGYDDEVDSHKDFERFIREHFFTAYDTVGINSVIKDMPEEQNITVRFGKEPSKPIHNLGDGINSLLNILYPIFTAPNDAWIFIEEPELHLHPGMQRIFITELIENKTLKKKNLKYFITTHSNHILDISSDVSDVSIYSLSKIKENHHRIRVAKSGDMNILSDLGVQNSSVYLSNCTIWVEGITDRLYLSKYLDCFIKEKTRNGEKVKPFIEDLNYAFFLYGGSNIVHYIFKEKNETLETEQLDTLKEINACFLSNRTLLIADEDKGKEKRHEIFANQQSDYFLYEKLKVREIENLLSIEFLQKHLSDVVKSVSDEDILKLNMVKAKLKSEYLGTYIIDCAEAAGVSFPKSFRGESGTVNPNKFKKLLAETAYRHMTWDMMTKEAQELAQRVYEFVESNNS